MKCEIQWIDQVGNKTPDNNEAIGLAQCFDPRFPSVDPAKQAWDVVPSKMVPSKPFPICQKHAELIFEKKLIFWSLLPLVGQDHLDNDLIRKCPTPQVITSIINVYPAKCESILKSLQYNYLCDYWSFTLDDLYIGAERDGYLHS